MNLGRIKKLPDLADRPADLGIRSSKCCKYCMLYINQLRSTNCATIIRGTVIYVLPTYSGKKLNGSSTNLTRGITELLY